MLRVQIPEEISPVWRPIIERQVTVRPDGMISVDLIGDLPATGRTVMEIARDIEQRVSRFKRDAVATVSVVLAQSATVTVFGEVQAQGNFPLQRDTRVAEAIGLLEESESWPLQLSNGNVEVKSSTDYTPITRYTSASSRGSAALPAPRAPDWVAA